MFVCHIESYSFGFFFQFKGNLKDARNYLSVTISQFFFNSILPAGFIFIVNPFLPGTQWQWIEKCIKDYPCKPNLCNLDAHMERTCTNTIWDESRSFER